MIEFNNNIRLILADVDETIADVYKLADQPMILELEKLLLQKRVLFLVSGGGLQSIRERITDFISPVLRHRVIIAHCSGAEVWGFDSNGDLKGKPYYGIYEGVFTDEQKKKWREIINLVVEKFHLKTFSTEPKQDFINRTNGDPLSVMLADRGPQITFEFVNAVHLTEEQKISIEQLTGIPIPQTHDSYDLRIPVMEFIGNLYKDAKLPIRPQLGGTMALDSIIEGVDKTAAIKFVLEHESILTQLDINKESIKEADEIEIWGDKFGQKKGGPDFQMCLAVSNKVRAIDFRKEDVEEIPKGYNIQIWDGVNELHNGLLEYLQSSKK